MKKVLLSFLLILAFFGQKTFAATTIPAPRDATTVVAPEKPHIVPAVLVILAEMTAAEVALVGVGAAATVATVHYYATTEAPSINIDWGHVLSPDEVLDVPKGPGMPGPKGPNKPWMPKLNAEETFLLAVKLSTLGYQGWLRISSQGAPSEEAIKAELLKLYDQDPKFAAQIHQMQMDYEAGKMVAVPVYKPGSAIFDHYLYMFKVKWPEPKKVLPAPGDASWSAGLKHVRSSFEKVKAGTALPYDYSRIASFTAGDCMGDQNCLQLQQELGRWITQQELKWGTSKELISFCSDYSLELFHLDLVMNLSKDDEKFLKKVEANPEILSDIANMLRLVRIFDEIPEGEFKERLRAILNKFQSSGSGQEAEYAEPAIDKIVAILNFAEGTQQNSPEFQAVLEKMQKIKEANQKLEDDYLVGNEEGTRISDKEYIKRLLSLDEKAELVFEEYKDLVERDPSTITKEIENLVEPINPAVDYCKDLQDLMSAMRNMKGEFEKLEKAYKAGDYDLEAYKYELKKLEKKWLKLLSQYRQFVKDNYILPESVWESGREGQAFTSDWLQKILDTINGDRTKVNLRISLKIYRDTYGWVNELLVGVGLRRTNYSNPNDGTR